LRRIAWDAAVPFIASPPRSSRHVVISESSNARDLSRLAVKLPAGDDAQPDQYVRVLAAEYHVGVELASYLGRDRRRLVSVHFARTSNENHAKICTCCVSSNWLVAWYSGRTSVFDRRTFPVLRSTYN